MYYARPVPEANPESSISGVVLCVVIIFIFVILFRGVRAQQQCPGGGPAVVYTTENSGPAMMVPSVGYAEKSEKDSTSPQDFMPYNAAA